VELTETIVMCFGVLVALWVCGVWDWDVQVSGMFLTHLEWTL